jgi:hypothetical protein
MATASGIFSKEFLITNLAIPAAFEEIFLADTAIIDHPRATIAMLH